MSVEIVDSEALQLRNLKEYLKSLNCGYILKRDFDSSKYYTLYYVKEVNGLFGIKFKRHIKKTYNIFIYDNYIYLEVSSKDVEEISKLFDAYLYKVRIKVIDDD